MLLLLQAGCGRAPGVTQPAHEAHLVRSSDPLPALLSQTGAFPDVPSMRPAAGLLPYEINVPFWSDGADKRRWMALPAGGAIGFSPTGEWAFPPGAVFVKHFERQGHRLETRVLVYDGHGDVHGASYRWRADGRDADAVDEAVRADGWYYPGRADCVVCHTKASGGVLGVKTRQVNRDDQLARWSALGVFDHPVKTTLGLPALSTAAAAANPQQRARSWLDANCAHCHRPGGVAGNFDARFDTPLAQQNLIGGPVLIDLGIDGARAIAPRDPWRSIVLARVETPDQTKMPPLGHETVDRAGAAILREWIQSLPGTPVLAPPAIAPRGGEFAKVARVELRADPGAVIRYTLDGSLPGKSSPIYQRPLELTEPATLRARAYKDGMTRSIVVQETFVVNP